MNEHRRLQYLEAIGIDSYVPRWLLPNAPAAKFCELPSSELETDREAGVEAFSKDGAGISPAVTEYPGRREAQSTVAHEPVRSETVSSLSKSLSSVLDDLSGASPRAQSLRPTERQDEEAVDHVYGQSADSVELASESERVSFQLGLWFTDTAIQVVDSREPGDALPTAALLHNIFIACGLMETNLPAMETQVWPFPGTSEKEQGWHDAFTTMSDFFQFRFKAKPASAMILCGEDAVRSVVGPDVDYETALFRPVPLKQLGIDAIILPSLRDFLYKPELKSSLWHALASLKNNAR